MLIKKQSADAQMNKMQSKIVIIEAPPLNERPRLHKQSIIT